MEVSEPGPPACGLLHDEADSNCESAASRRSSLSLPLPCPGQFEGLRLARKPVLLSVIEPESTSSPMIISAALGPSCCWVGLAAAAKDRAARFATPRACGGWAAAPEAGSERAASARACTSGHVAYLLSCSCVSCMPCVVASRLPALYLVGRHNKHAIPMRQAPPQRPAHRAQHLGLIACGQGLQPVRIPPAWGNATSAWAQRRGRPSVSEHRGFAF